MIGRIDIRGIKGTPMRVIYVQPGDKSPNYATEPGRHGLVEFYDLRYDHTPDGQFITRYLPDTYMKGWQGDGGYDCGRGLDLQCNIPDWKIGADTRLIVGQWINYLTYNQTQEEGHHA
jgi:hypothetical protein